MTSEEIRLKGNQAYRLASADGLAPCLQKTRYEEALRLYRQALYAAKNDNEITSACKNMGLCYLKLSEQLLEDPEKEPRYFVWSVREGVSCFLDCLTRARPVKTQDWIDDVSNFLARLILQAIDALDALNRSEKIAALTEISKAFHPYSLHGFKLDAAANFYSELASEVFKESLDVLGEEAPLFSKCLAKVFDCYCPLELARKFAESEEITEEIDDLSEQVYFQQCICESVIARSAADRLLGETLYETEELNIEMVHLVLDKYKEAIVSAREVDTENEAIAISRIARVYKKVLRMDERAHSYYLNAVQLANSMMPRSFYSEPWYAEALEAVNTYREKKLKEEAEKHQKERQPYLDALKDDLAALKDIAEEGSAALLTFLYSKHPPKKDKHKIGSLEPDDLKKTLQHAILHYHPDKQDADDMKWKVFCEEVVKYLNDKYSYMKCG